MSKLLDLAKTLETNSKAQAEATEKVLASVFAKHENTINDALNASQQKIKSAINAHNQNIQGTMLKHWLWLLLSVITLLIALQAILWWQGEKIAQNWQAIARQNSQLEALAKQGDKIQISTCGSKSQFTANVRNYFARERTVTDASRSLEQSSQHLERTAPAVERAIRAEKALVRGKRRFRGMRMGRSRGGPEHEL